MRAEVIIAVDTFAPDEDLRGFMVAVFLITGCFGVLVSRSCPRRRSRSFQETESLDATWEKVC